MVRSDYRCSECGYETEHTFNGMTIPPSIEAWCVPCENLTEHRRLWSGIHTGRGSSGEPAR